MANINLSDKWAASGTDLEEYRALVKEVTKATRFVKVTGDDITFYYRLDTPELKDVYKLVIINPEHLAIYESMLCGYKTNLKQAPPAAQIGNLSKAKVNQTLAEESFDSTGVMLNVKGEGMYMAESATPTLCMRADMAGERTAAKSLYLTQAISEALGAKKREITIVVKEVGRDRKAFAFMSPKYEPIPMTILPDAVDLLLKDGNLGKGVVRSWYMDHTFTSLAMEFPDAAEDIAETYGLSDQIIPGLVVMSSDTGASSLIVRSTYRRPNCSSYVVLDEYAHKHSGRITTDEILDATDKDIMSKIRKLPEALAAKMTKIIGTGLVGTIKEQSANEKAVQGALKQAMATIGLKKELGLQRTKQLLEGLYAEINPAMVYTEYDIAMTLMGLPDRTEGLSREMATRIAKCCGKAPFADLSKISKKSSEDELTLLPEGI